MPVYARWLLVAWLALWLAVVVFAVGAAPAGPLPLR